MLQSGIGIYLGSEESYTVFKELVDPVIEIYHGYKPHQKHVSDWDLKKLNFDSSLFDDKYCLSTRIRVARNVKGYPLGTFVERDQRN